MKTNKNGFFKWSLSPLQLTNNKGFTLLESVIALLVFALCFSLFSMAVKQVQSIHNAQQSDRQLEWHLFLNQFEYDIKELKLKEVTEEEVVFKRYIADTGEAEYISYKRTLQKLLRKVNYKGYQPMLMKLRKVNFKLNGNFLVVQVEFINGETYQSQINLKDHIEETVHE